ncbi:nucleic acid/nucleotide deaminase domain-containing protein [Kitasatospora sp. NPDC088134]|uniref:nucleic acid/nucleotide deaminase domain-containing protein n=1 Tax=Kitasatospora sp. NPDC088134 TaxID=3364071 RepID=UPI003816D7FE
MTAELAQRLLERFGPEGLRRPDAAEFALVTVPDAAARLLTATGLPVQVGPYFRTSPQDALALGDLTAGQDRSGPHGGEERWARLGTDGGTELCLDPQGRVWSVFTDFEEPSRPVNTSLEAFLSSLAELDRSLAALAAAQHPDQVFAEFTAVESRLRALDPHALDAELWWSRVLEDVRHTRGVPSYASFKYLDTKGEPQIVTAGGALALHAEEALWYRLQALGVEPEQVVEIYTELQACFMPGHYCSVWMAETFPQAKFTHSYDYGDTAAERDAGIRELAAALTRRAD